MQRIRNKQLTDKSTTKTNKIINKHNNNQEASTHTTSNLIERTSGYIANPLVMSGQSFTPFLHSALYTAPMTLALRATCLDKCFKSGDTTKSWLYRLAHPAKRQLSKRLLQIGALSLLALPVKHLLATEPTDVVPTKYDMVMQNGQIVVATTKDKSIFFEDGELSHGFGYDVARRYADYLGVPMTLKTYDTQEAVLNALKNGDADMALTDMLANSEIKTNLIACDDTTKGKVNQHGLNVNLGFSFLPADEVMLSHSAAFLCSPDSLSHSQVSARFYDQTLLKNAYSEQHFKKALKQRLPLYENAFKRGADKYNHDWQLLAAISYQESHLDPNAISPTGVQGLMMLTNDTAVAMGVNDRTDAIESIHGGARYLQQIETKFADVPESERLWFVLAAYNMGPNAVKRIQYELSNAGKDANNWGNVYGYLSDNASQNGRYVQCMHYVANIRTYLEAIKSMA